MRRINGRLIAGNADRRARCPRHWMGLVSEFFDNAQDRFDLTVSRVGFHYDEHVLFILSQIWKSTASPGAHPGAQTSCPQTRHEARKVFAIRARADGIAALAASTFSREH